MDSTNELRQLLTASAGEMGLCLQAAQADQLLLYKELLLEWNQKMNLTAILGDKEIIQKHFVDSLSVAPILLRENAASFIDIGTGAGFPGIPLAIALPEIGATLMDATRKRLTFVEAVQAALALRNVTVIHGRAEECTAREDLFACFDAAVSRAVAALPLLLAYALPFVKEGGVFVAMKGPQAAGEINDAKPWVERLGGEITDTINCDLPFSDITHTCVIVRKKRLISLQDYEKLHKMIKNPKK